MSEFASHIWAAPFLQGMVSVRMSLSDPSGAMPLESAVAWIEATLLGSVAVTVAVIAVAFCGFLMLSGRIAWRRGATTILGCFLVFGARDIALGLQSLGGAEPLPDDPPVYGPVTPAPPLPLPPPPVANQRTEVRL